MPFTPDPSKLAADPELIRAARSALRNYITTSVMQEPIFNGPNGTPVAWQKRRAYALRWIGAAHQSVDMGLAVELIAELDPDLMRNYGSDLFAYLYQNNPTGQSIFACQRGVAFGYNNVAVDSGASLYDALAGVTYSDLN